MGWNDLREKWQSLDPSSDAEDSDTQAILTRARRREKKLMRRVYIRDALETIVAVLIAPAMVALAWKLFAHGLIFAGVSAAALAVWAAFVPVRLWYARRHRNRPEPDQKVIEFLHAERQMCETQARMLETVALWYLAPAWIGCVGIYAGIRGFGLSTIIYVSVVTVFYAMIFIANRSAAKHVFRQRAREIDAELQALGDT